MTNALRSSLPVVSAVAVLFFAACGNPPPTCSATDTAYTVCADEQVWECPVATAEQLAAKKAISDACKTEADPTGCLLKAEYEMFPMVLKVKCAEGGQVCVEAAPPAQSASCQMK